MGRNLQQRQQAQILQSGGKPETVPQQRGPALQRAQGKRLARLSSAARSRASQPVSISLYESAGDSRRLSDDLPHRRWAPGSGKGPAEKRWQRTAVRVGGLIGSMRRYRMVSRRAEQAVRRPRRPGQATNPDTVRLPVLGARASRRARLTIMVEPKATLSIATRGAWQIFVDPDGPIASRMERPAVHLRPPRCCIGTDGDGSGLAPDCASAWRMAWYVRRIFPGSQTSSGIHGHDPRRGRGCQNRVVIARHAEIADARIRQNDHPVAKFCLPVGQSSTGIVGRLVVADQIRCQPVKSWARIESMVSSSHGAQL